MRKIEMIPRSILAAITTKIHQPISQSSVLSQTLITKSNLSIPPHSFSLSGHSQNLDNFDILNHKDWLSRTEVIKIFQSLKDPNSTLPILTQLSKRKDYKPNEAIYTVVINNLAKAKNFDGIKQVMETIRAEKRCKLSDDFFYNVIKIYGHLAGRINRSIETLFDMPNYNCWPTVKTFNFVLNLLVNAKQFDIIHEVYMGASKLGVEIDVCSLNIMIKGLCKSRELQAAFQLLDEFPRQGCRPNVRTFSTLMHGLCERGRVDEAFGLFEKMEKEGIEPDTIAINILISGFRKNGRAEKSIELFNRMMVKGCEPSSSTYQEILYCLLDGKKFVEAKDFMRKMVSKRVIPSFESYKSITQGLCSQNLVGEADLVLKQMVENDFVPKMGMWKQIVQCMLSRNSNSDLFEKLISVSSSNDAISSV